jgi:hypothetical protein
MAITLLHGWLNNPDIFNWFGGEAKAEEQFRIGYLPVT